MPVVSDQICNIERPVLTAQSPKNGEIFALVPVFAQYLPKYASYRKSYSIFFKRTLILLQFKLKLNSVCPEVLEIHFFENWHFFPKSETFSF